MHMDFCDLMQFSKAKKKALSISQLGMACSLQVCPLLHLPPDSFFNALLKMNTEFTDNFFEHFNLEKQRTEAHYCIAGCMAEWPELHEHCRQNTPDLRQSAVSRGKFLWWYNVYICDLETPSSQPACPGPNPVQTGHCCAVTVVAPAQCAQGRLLAVRACQCPKDFQISFLWNFYFIHFCVLSHFFTGNLYDFQQLVPWPNLVFTFYNFLLRNNF